MYRLLREACSSGEASLALKRRDKLPALQGQARRGDDGGPGAVPASFRTAWEEGAAADSRANRAVGDAGLEFGLIAREMRRKQRAKIGTNVTFPSAFHSGTLLLEGTP
jgi:hypothetical protein